MAKLLVIDDDRDILTQMRAFLENAGHTVFTFTRGDDAVEQVKKYGAQLVITDIIMPGVTGGAVYETLRQKCGSKLPIIVCSGSRMKIKAAKDPFFVQMQKPIDFTYLIKRIDELLRESNALDPHVDNDLDISDLETHHG